ncbi:MAG: methylenetetrahydrofolate--tRNA-(uracil(54)-C(5))-methyltransferase (FADH(2)-oxidizing) TrmFO [Clostridia bacterium]
MIKFFALTENVEKMLKTGEKINVIGAGLAGCEAALFLADKGHTVFLFEMKPKFKSPAHKLNTFAELVCSNSLKSVEHTSAGGLLKFELETLGCQLLEVAKKCAVPAGGALAVDRNKFSSAVTDKIFNHPNIKVIDKKITEINLAEPTIIATGPLTDDELFLNIQKLIGTNNCYFFDAVAPIIDGETIDFNYAFWANRYDKGGTGDYLNCPLSKEEYNLFHKELINGKLAKLEELEKIKVFEGCMPVEVMAGRGLNSLRFGPMKPVGLYENGIRPYAVLQLRKEDEQGKMFNMVGFQTNLTFPEQKRIFSLIPALKNAEFIRYGVLHRNSYVNAPSCLNIFCELNMHENIYIAGQLSGVEGYVESIASGLYVAINMHRKLMQKSLIPISTETAMGAMFDYISKSSTVNFQPMNANYGIIKPLETQIRDKNERKQIIFERSKEKINQYKEKIYGKS